jgi:hypothetical protein
MYDIQLHLDKTVFSIRWMTRLLSFLVSSMFLLILFLAVGNEDKPQGMAIPVLALLVLTIMGCLAAWRWEKAGGIVVIISALCLSITAYSASLTFGLGSLSFLPALIYGAPFLILGILFLVCAKEQAKTVPVE